MMSKREKLIYGVGVNDAGYVTKIVETITCIDGKQKYRVVWRCPIYQTWENMLQRSYSSNYQIQRPTYIGCTVTEEWHRFSTFKKWMEKQDWEGKTLDKDLLEHGNKVYGPEQCVFISKIVNSFMTERTGDRGEWPIGVYWHSGVGKFRAKCRNPFTKKQEHLGSFSCPNEAHQAWLKRKRELAVMLAGEQTDERVAKALISRYDVDVYTPLHGSKNMMSL